MLSNELLPAACRFCNFWIIFFILLSKKWRLSAKTVDDPRSSKSMSPMSSPSKPGLILRPSNFRIIEDDGNFPTLNYLKSDMTPGFILREISIPSGCNLSKTGSDGTAKIIFAS